MKKILWLWHRMDRQIQKIEQLLIVVGLAVILGTGLLSIVLRNTVGWGLAFAEIVARQLTVWLGLLGATLATSSAEHISIDAFSRVLNRKQLRVNRVVMGIFCLCGCGVLTYCAFAFVWFYVEQPVIIEIAGFHVTNWFFLVIFPIAFVLMCIRYFVQTVEHIYALRGDLLPWSLAAHLEAEEEEKESISSHFNGEYDEKDKTVCETMDEQKAKVASLMADMATSVEKSPSKDQEGQ